MKKLNISILGCGWLGLPLLKSLVSDGHNVRGSSRNPQTLAEIREAGAKAFDINLPQDLPAGFTDECDVLIFTLPPGGRKFGAAATDKYLAALASLTEWLSWPDGPALIYTSSTGVYGAQPGIVTEQTEPKPDTHSARAVRRAEEWFMSGRYPLTILRLAGLVAEDRHPGRFFGGKDRPISSADTPVNLVHRDDVILAVKQCLQNNQTPIIYNVCAAAHPRKGDFYTRAAGALGLNVKGTEPGGENGKTINSDKLRALGWAPKWDDLDLAFLETERKK
jgi:nucleoside-diphosphate-sugar epimerase